MYYYLFWLLKGLYLFVNRSNPANFRLDISYMISQYKFGTPVSPLLGLNYQKSVLSGCLHHNNYLCAKFSPKLFSGLSCAVIDQSVSNNFLLYTFRYKYILCISLKSINITTYLLLQQSLTMSQLRKEQ